MIEMQWRWLIWLVLFGAALCTMIRWHRGHLGFRIRKRSPYRRRQFDRASFNNAHVRRKPVWVKHEIVRLKAHLPSSGCRKIRDAFNRAYASQGMRVGKTFVATVLREHHYEIAQLRLKWKNKVPTPLPCNHTWGIDATGKADESGQVHAILGIVDHGSRRAISLQPLRTLTAIATLRVMLDAIELFGKPRFVRTDNASQFRSKLFRFAMAWLGIRQRFSKPGMPWMNGRVERFFGTLKERLNHLAVTDFAGLALALAEFKVWYNRVRPHQHLGGRTPAEAWDGIDPYQRLPKEIRYVVGWDGLLTGFYSRY